MMNQRKLEAPLLTGGRASLRFLPSTGEHQRLRAFNALIPTLWLVRALNTPRRFDLHLQAALLVEEEYFWLILSSPFQLLLSLVTLMGQSLIWMPILLMILMLISYMQKAGDSWDISPQIFLDFPQNFRLRTRNKYCTQAIA